MKGNEAVPRPANVAGLPGPDGGEKPRPIPECSQVAQGGNPQPAPPELKSPVYLRRLCLNIGLLIFLVIELGLWIYIHPLSLPLTILGGIFSGAAVGGIVRLVLEIFREEYKDYGRRIFQSYILTGVLAVLSFLMLLPASNSARLLFNPPIVLCLLPAKGLFMQLEDAVPGQSPGYKLYARYGGSWKSLPLQGAQSVYVGAPENTRAWLQQQAKTGSLAEEQRTKMEDYLVQVEVPDEDRDFFLARWREEPRFLGSRPLEVGGDVEIVLTSSASSKALVSKKVPIRAHPEIQLVFLEIQ